jgi:hypothetical protein
MTRRMGKWLRLVAEVAAVLAVLALALQRFGLPWYVRRQIVAAGAAVNLPITSLAVRDVGLDGTELTDISVGAKGEALRVGRVRANYSLATLMRGALTYTVVDGLELPLALKGGRLDLGFLGQMRIAHAPAGGSRDLPFKQVWLRSCTIVLAHDPLGVAIPAHVHISNQGPGRVGFDGWVQAPSGWVHIIGWYDSATGDYDFYMRADNADLRPLLDLLPAELLNLPGRGGGTATVSARLTRSAGKAASDLTLDAGKLWFRGTAGTVALQASDGTVKLATHLGPAYLPESLEATAHIGALLLADRPLTNLDLKVSLSPGSDQWHFQAGGELTGTHADVTGGVLGGWPQRSREGGLTVGAALHVAGPLPRELISWLHGRAISVTSPGGGESGGGGTWTADAKLSAEAGAADGPAWRVQVCDARVALAKTDLALNGTGIGVRGLEGQIGFNAAVDSGGAVTLDVATGRLVAIGDVVLPPKLAQFVRKKGVEELLTLDLDAPATLRWQLGGDQSGSHFAVPALALRVAGAKVTAMQGAVDAADVHGQLVLQGDGGPDGAQIALGPGAGVSATQLAVAFNGQTIKATGINIAPPAPAPGAASPVPIVTLVCQQGVWQSPMISLPLTAAVERVDGSLSGGATIGAAKTAFTATLGYAAGAPTVRGRLTCSDAQVVVASAGLKVTGIRADIPVSWNCPAQGDGTYAIKQIDIGASHLPGLSGTAAVAGTRAQMTLDWPLLAKQSFRGSAWIDAAPGGPHGAFHGELPPTKIDDPGALAGLLAPCKGMTFTGSLGAKIDLAVDGKAIVPMIHADLDNATLAMPKSGITLAGIRGGLTIDSLNPLSSPGNQRLTIDKITVSKFTIAGNSLDYRIESPHSVLLERYQGGWAGGQVYTYDMRLDPAKPVLDATLFFDNLQLNQMLAVVMPQYASGQGRLYGRLPIRVAWPHVAIGSGYLYAAPGGGTLQVRQPQTLAPIIEQSNLADMKQNLLEALKDYQFDILSVDLIQDSRGLTARLVTSGRGHAGPVPVEIKRLTVNLIGVHSLLDVFLELSSMIGSPGR